MNPWKSIKRWWLLRRQKDATRVRLYQNDVLIVRLPGRLPLEQMERMQHYLQRALGTKNVLVFAGEIDLMVLERELLAEGRSH